MEKPLGREAAVFVDRDGTMNVDIPHLSRVEDFQLLPGAASAIARLREAGYPVIVVTNQSAVARGLVTEAGLGDIHAEMHRQLARAGAEVDAVYYCPHHPEYGMPPYRCTCTCRKPNPGLLQRAALEYGIDLRRSFMVGDNLSDLEAGWNAGCRSLLVLTGYGKETRERLDPELVGRVGVVAEDLSGAADWILRLRG